LDLFGRRAAAPHDRKVKRGSAASTSLIGQKGTKTPQMEVDLIIDRLKRLKEALK
jgi:hypothetical protein